MILMYRAVSEVICRFQIRVARVSRLGSEPAIWKEAQPFFCVSDEARHAPTAFGS